MNIIKYTPELSKKIRNTNQLPRGTGAKYLLVLVNGNEFIVHSWKRKLPKTIKSGYALIEFGWEI